MNKENFPKINLKLGLYPIVNNIEWISRLLKLGIQTLQLRIKNANFQEIESEIYDSIILSKKYNARLFINDYWQLAIKYNAYGVHLGQEDLNFADLTAIRQAGLYLGVSTHNDIELDNAIALCPSYIALGHIFPTKTKHMSSKPQGLLLLKQQLARLKDISTVAIGGISIKRAPAVLATGVGSIAVVSAITQSPNWHIATQKLLSLVQEAEMLHTKEK